MDALNILYAFGIPSVLYDEHNISKLWIYLQMKLYVIVTLMGHSLEISFHL
jgi:hypothetical protein